jgi:osmoprotectant transport system substrate-binding protein
VIRKHNRRAAKAAFSIAFGVALILGGTTAASAAGDAAAATASQKATPIIVGTKNFPEQYVLGQLYKQALEAQGFTVKYKENIASTELIDTSLRAGRSRCTRSTRGSCSR